MKYQLYKPVRLNNCICGYLLPRRKEMPNYVFFWPGSNAFMAYGLDWEKLSGSPSMQFILTYHECIKEFDSIEDAKKWLVEQYFEWFL